MVLNELIRTTVISPACIALIIYLLSNKPGWRINVKQLINHYKSKLSRDAVYDLVNEALAAGYMRRVIIRKGGRFSGFKYYVIEKPKNASKTCFQPFPGLPDTVAPDPVIPDAKEELSRKNDYIEENNNNVVVVSSLNELKLNESVKMKISKEYSSKEIDIAVERIKKMNSRKSDAACLWKALKEPDEWEDKKSKDEIEKENLGFLKDLSKLDGKQFGNTRIIIGNKYIELTSGMKCDIISAESIDFQRDVKEKLKLLGVS